MSAVCVQRPVQQPVHDVAAVSVLQHTMIPIIVYDLFVFLLIWCLSVMRKVLKY